MADNSFFSLPAASFSNSLTLWASVDYTTRLTTMPNSLKQLGPEQLLDIAGAVGEYAMMHYEKQACRTSPNIFSFCAYPACSSPPCLRGNQPAPPKSERGGPKLNYRYLARSLIGRHCDVRTSVFLHTDRLVRAPLIFIFHSFLGDYYKVADGVGRPEPRCLLCPEFLHI